MTEVSLPQNAVSKEQLSTLLSKMGTFFDVVRIVDPVSMIVYSLENGELIAQPDGCFHVWKRTGRCENCVSVKSYINNKRLSKFDFIDSDIFHVVAQPLVVNGQRFVLEVVTESDDEVLISAYGINDFVEKITDYNHKIYTDQLTGVANRRYLDERFDILIERSAQRNNSLASIMVDLDDFKDINDKYGHLAGDEVLQYVAETLVKSFKPVDDDIVSRYGGDEFFVALHGLNKLELEKRMNEIQQTVAKDARSPKVSIGVFYQQNITVTSPVELLERADKAMYSVKEHNKNGHVIVEE